MINSRTYYLTDPQKNLLKAIVPFVSVRPGRLRETASSGVSGSGNTWSDLDISDSTSRLPSAHTHPDFIPSMKMFSAFKDDQVLL